MYQLVIYSPKIKYETSFIHAETMRILPYIYSACTSLELYFSYLVCFEYVVTLLLFLGY